MSGVTEVAVVGAGPYGLSVAAHLQHLGVPHRIFGAPMTFWLRMPASINLKSFAFATNVWVPRPDYRFTHYCRTNGLEDVEPCTMASFAAYGLWVQREILPDLEPVEVTALRAGASGFELETQEGTTCRARRVVVATGLSHFAYLPEALRRLPPELVSHTADHEEFSRFAGRDVAVVGGGASALEAATMLLEAGARPLLLVREREVIFHTKLDFRRSLLERLRQPNSSLGPGRKSWALDRFPGLLHYVPEARRVRFTRGYLGPAGPWWLYERFHGKVPLRVEAHVTGAAEVGGRVRLQVSEKGATSDLMVDHVVAGTGYVADVDRLPFFDAALRARVRRVDRAPALDRHFQSSVPGLYFVGAAAALSFGPLFRFVAGGRHAAPTVAKHIARARRSLPTRSWKVASQVPHEDA